MKHVLTALFLGTTLSACVATTPPIEESRLREVRSGSTAYADVVRRFGTPSLVSRNPDGTSFATYIPAEPGGSPKEIVPLVAGVYRDSVTFHFDTKGLLTDVKATSRTGAQGTLVQQDRVPLAASGQAGPAASVASSPTAASPSAPAAKSGAWLWRLPDWLPAAPRENR